MSYATSVNAYREREVLSASPGKLVVMIYDHLLVCLRRARMAIEAKNIELRAESMNKARDAVMELLVSTDVERGGEIAVHLRSIYAFVYSELLTIGTHPDAARLDRVTGIIANLREAFATIVSESPSVGVA